MHDLDVESVKNYTVPNGGILLVTYSGGKNYRTFDIFGPKT